MASNNKASITGPNKRMKKLTSDVWEHFLYLPSDDHPGVGEAWCVTCAAKLKAGSKKYGTRHLRDHVGSNKCKAKAQAGMERIHRLLDEVHSKGLLFPPDQHP